MPLTQSVSFCILYLLQCHLTLDPPDFFLKNHHYIFISIFLFKNHRMNCHTFAWSNISVTTGKKNCNHFLHKLQHRNFGFARMIGKEESLSHSFSMRNEEYIQI